MADRVVVSRIQPIARARPQYTLESKDLTVREADELCGYTKRSSACGYARVGFQARTNPAGVVGGEHRIPVVVRAAIQAEASPRREHMSPRLAPCKRSDFISCLRLLGFDGPYPGTRHSFMLYQEYRQTIPSYGEYDPAMLSELPKQVGEVLGRRISREEWANLKRGRASTENP